MPKFTIYASEKVYYAFDVEAENEKDAVSKAEDYVVSLDDVQETENFQIWSIEEKENA